jgi:AcrR family transcriptional regulator
MVAGKRPYSSELRADQARRTRAQIVDAAARLFVDLGYTGTTVAAVAAEAGVSRKTVFTSVGGKVQLLKLAYDVTLAGDDEPVPLRDRPALQAVIAEPDPYRQVALFAAAVTENSRRVARLHRVLRAAADTDREAAELYQRWEDQRHEAMARGPVRTFAEKKVLRPDVTRREAADLLWMLVDPTTYDRLVHERGWSDPRFRAWLAETMRSQLLVPPTVPRA